MIDKLLLVFQVDCLLNHHPLNLFQFPSVYHFQDFHLIHFELILKPEHLHHTVSSLGL